MHGKGKGRQEPGSGGGAHSHCGEWAYVGQQGLLSDCKCPHQLFEAAGLILYYCTSLRQIVWSSVCTAYMILVDERADSDSLDFLSSKDLALRGACFLS